MIHLYGMQEWVKFINSDRCQNLLFEGRVGIGSEETCGKIQERQEIIYVLYKDIISQIFAYGEVHSLWLVY